MHPQQLRIADYTYDLPAERIALHPLSHRDQSKLLYYRKGVISPHVFNEIPQLLPPHSLLVLNNTRVVEARLLFQKPTGGIIELFCLEPEDAEQDFAEAFQQKKEIRYRCYIGGASKWKPGECLQLEIQTEKETLHLTARYVEKQNDRFCIAFSWTPETYCFAEVLEAAGTIPLPPYLKRKPIAEDNERYQTVYAHTKGSVAAPTAGLHFTPDILQALQRHQIELGQVTLHVGAGTFKPVQAEAMSGHTMHQEHLDVTDRLIQQLIVHAGHGITAVGTTSLRTIESLYWMGVKLAAHPQLDARSLALKQWEAYELDDAGISPRDALTHLLEWMSRNNTRRLITSTQLLIAPGFRFHLANRLVTNFHQPRSTLLLLVAACIGADWRKVYAYALEHGFRFLSYGDASLLEFR